MVRLLPAVSSNVDPGSLIVTVVEPPADAKFKVPTVTSAPPEIFTTAVVPDAPQLASVATTVEPVPSTENVPSLIGSGLLTATVPPALTLICAPLPTVSCPDTVCSV